MALFGGIGTLLGPVLGVAAIETISFTLSDIDVVKSYWPVILGIIMLVVVTWRPSGIMGLVLSRRERIGSFGIGRTEAPQPVPDETPENRRGAA
jgi:branched-chain amino acid transport system permease protein